MCCFPIHLPLSGKGDTICVLLFLFCSSLLAEASEPHVEVNLLPEIVSTRSRVTLGDVAEIRGDKQLAKALRSIDVCLVEEQAPCLLTSKYIQLRLSLQNLPMQQITMTGADHILVQYQRENSLEVMLASGVSVADKSGDTVNTTRLIEAAIVQAIAERLHRPESEIRVRVLRSVEQLFQKDLLQDPALVPEITLPEEGLLGRRSVMVRLGNGEQQQLFVTRSVPVEIAIRQTGILVTHSLTRGERLTSHNLSSDVRFVTALQEELSYAEVLGRNVRRSLRAGDRLTKHDLEDVALEPTGEIVVRPRSALRLIARNGSLEYVVPLAEAMQSGRIGQVIRVKNVHSNRIVHARVISADEAVVDLR